MFEVKKQETLRYCRPTVKTIPARKVKWEHAKTAAKSITIEPGGRYFFVVSGNFIFAEFIEALIYKHKWHVKRVIISTLSLSMDNVFTFVNLLHRHKLVDQLDMIVNNSFFVHERNDIIRALVEECDIDDKFQLAVAGTHTKITQIETHCGLKITIHGSSNLRSSGNLEQGMIETCGDLYDFNQDMHESIIAKYATINKAVRRKVLWEAVAETEKEPYKPLEF
jgi:hypothetical protein